MQNKNLRISLLFLCLASVLINSADAATIEVHPGESIQNAIDQASSGDEVFIFSGTYSEDIVMKDGVNVIGESSQGAEINGTILFKDAVSSLKNITLLFSQGDFTSYNNTYYVDWKLEQDAGITVINSSPTIQNCLIKPDLDSITPPLERYGKGIQIWNMYQNPDISPQIEGNIIQDTDCGIYYFSQAFGGGINGKIKNNVLYNSTYGIALRMHKENPEIVNNIIINGAYAGIFLTYRDDPLFDARKANIHHNDIWNNVHNYWLESDGAEFDLAGFNDNMSVNPLFKDAPNGDFRLDLLSPCIGQGENGENMGSYSLAEPTGTITVNDGAGYTSYTSVNLTLSAWDAESIVDKMRFSNDGLTWSTPEDYTATKPWVLTAGYGEKTVYVKFRNIAGNWSDAFSDTIIFAKIVPTSITYSYDDLNRLQSIVHDGTNTAYTYDEVGNITNKTTERETP